ncbi:polyprenyl synthetase family protein [Lysinibacillus piscis]|uniref:Polyprenyl synthetase n=1 Tax=Lysinibacillus piscis TaxID=2518931 RepID=A0ABQ5NMB5_9BACI|nr:polyprenyl synthetase family protein [Lysinibacillus sp. KH24]GLC89453.1 polyprenyl synthetase [Lysinibacillus sp. KH24]
MDYLHKQIDQAFNRLLATETLISEELRSMMQCFKEEKTTTTSFSFGKLCVLHYKAFTDEVQDEIYTIAAAIELLILSFDIIDDLQDNDTDNLWSRTPALSLNTALAMTFLAANIIAGSSLTHKDQARDILVEYALRSINGQQLDLLNNCRDEQSYIDMITQKSGSLTGMCCLIGEVLAKGKYSTQVQEYGTNIGVIQQIKNDIQSLKVWNAHNDLFNKRYSLPIIYLLAQDTPASHMVKDYYNTAVKQELDYLVIEQELTHHGAIRYALAIKNIYKLKVLQMVDALVISDEDKTYLQALVK